MSAERAALSRLEARAGDSAGGASEAPSRPNPSVRSLVVEGEALVGATLTAQASFVEADEASSRYAWHRGATPLPGKSQRAYVVTADDLGYELSVLVTPVGPSGAGEAQRAGVSHAVALPSNVHTFLREGLDMGQQAFKNCHEGEKERQIIFRTSKGLKVQDAKAKTLGKSEGYEHTRDTSPPLHTP
jgi:hypothetical protein